MVERPDNELGRRRNFARRLVRESNRRAGSNIIRIGAGESYNHARAKFEVCMKLIEAGKEFYTEVIWENGGGRADIFVLDDMVVVECLESERVYDAGQKSFKYPEGLNFEIAKMVEGKLYWKTWREAFGERTQIQS